MTHYYHHEDRGNFIASDRQVKHGLNVYKRVNKLAKSSQIFKISLPVAFHKTLHKIPLQSLGYFKLISCYVNKS